MLWGVERSSFLSEHSVKGGSLQVPALQSGKWPRALQKVSGSQLLEICLLASVCWDLVFVSFFFFSSPYWSACALLKLKHVCSSGNIWLLSVECVPHTWWVFFNEDVLEKKTPKIQTILTIVCDLWCQRS